MRSSLLALLLSVPLLVSAQGPSKQELKVRRQLDRGRPYPAIRNATAMLIKGNHPEFYALRAEGYNKIAEHAKAEADARMAIRLLPDHTEGLYQLGLAEKGLGQLDSASFHLTEVVLRKADVDSRFSLAEVERMRGNLNMAAQYIEAAIALENANNSASARLHRLLGEIAAETGDTARAKAELDRAVELAPRDPVNYNSRAYYVHAWNGDHQAAIKDYDRAIKLNPNYSYAFNNRGWSRHQLGETAKGLKDIRRAKHKKVHNPYVYRNLGLIALETGDTAQACALFREALDKGFTALHGQEVEELIARSCGQAPLKLPPPTNAPDRPKEQTVPRSNAPE